MRQPAPPPQRARLFARDGADHHAGARTHCPAVDVLPAASFRTGAAPSLPLLCAGLLYLAWGATAVTAAPLANAATAAPAGSVAGAVQEAFSPQAATGGIGGLVLVADDSTPLVGALVFLEPVESVLPAPHVYPGLPSFRFAQMAVTDSTGSYQFDFPEGIPSGSYRVHVERQGYERAVLDVDLTGGGARLTVGLRLEPIALPALVVTADPQQAYVRTASATAERYGARRASVRARQQEHLETDARVLTAGDVAEAITAGEPDLFRALQRLPGVGRRDDYTAILWTRGASWTQTRVYFDGLPLYNPTHAGSLFSSVSPNGVGSVTYHPGVRSVQWGEGAAGILDLRSRSGGDGGKLAGSADLSLVSGQVALDGELLDQRVRWMVAGRRTHVDLVTAAWGALWDQDDLRIPYDFQDITGRVDFGLGPLELEGSSLIERDRLRGDLPGLLVGNAGRWGNRLIQATARLPLGPIEMSVSRGGTRFATVVSEEQRATPSFSASRQVSPVATLPALESGIDHDRTSFRIESRPSAARMHWALGYEVIEDRIRYDGPFSLLSEGLPGLVRDSTSRVPFRLKSERSYRASWGELRLRVRDGLDVQTGLRVESGDSVRKAGKRQVAPRISTRWKASPELTLSTGWGRSFQYTQAIGAAAGPLGPQLHLGHLWVLAGRGIPALQSDIVTAGADYWLSGNWLLGVNGYHREMTGITEPDPTTGFLRADRSHVEVESTARGVELSARHLVGRWTASFGYTLAQAETRTDSLRFASTADVTHSVGSTAGYRVNDGLRLGAAFSFASGVPFSRVVLVGDSLPLLGDPAANRTPVYVGLDLVLEYEVERDGWKVNTYVQLLNALGRPNRVTYAGSDCSGNGAVPDPACPPGSSIHDRFERGLPRLPLAGVRIKF